MRRVAVAVVLVAACNNGSSAVDAPVPNPFPCPCAEAPAGVPSCVESCGNNQIDECYARSPMGCKCVSIITETCDGPVDCVDLGYYGGNATCTSSCFTVDERTCDVCAPSTLACETVSSLLSAKRLEVSGTHAVLTTDNEIGVFDALLQPVRTFALPNVRDVVAVPAGWLVATAQPPRLATLDTAGVLGTPQTIPTADAPIMASGPADRVVLVWKQLVNAQVRAFVAIADTSGNIVVPASDLFATGDVAGVTSDGTSFFVGALGQLARVAPDGTRTIVSGFPAHPAAANDTVEVTWSGTTGWYVSWSAGTNAFTAQRFDANGAMLGARIAIDLGAPPLAFLADGDDLLVLRAQTTRLAVVRVASTGTAGAVTEVGIKAGAGAYLARRGSNAVVAWNKAGAVPQLALVAP